jgi:hypothetical protein
MIGILALAAAQAAIPAIKLNPYSDGTPVDVQTSQEFSGSCGPSVVRVLGVTSVTSDFFDIDLDAGRVIVRQLHKPDLVIDSDHGLSDHNGVACVAKDFQHFVLIWTACGGTICSDKYDFIVIDADEQRVASPTGACDEKCAFKLTGSPIPLKLNAGR